MVQSSSNEEISMDTEEEVLETFTISTTTFWFLSGLWNEGGLELASSTIRPRRSDAKVLC